MRIKSDIVSTMSLEIRLEIKQKEVKALTEEVKALAERLVRGGNHGGDHGGDHGGSGGDGSGGSGGGGQAPTSKGVHEGNKSSNTSSGRGRGLQQKKSFIFNLAIYEQEQECCFSYT